MKSRSYAASHCICPVFAMRGSIYRLKSRSCALNPLGDRQVMERLVIDRSSRALVRDRSGRGFEKMKRVLFSQRPQRLCGESFLVQARCTRNAGDPGRLILTSTDSYDTTDRSEPNS